MIYVRSPGPAPAAARGWRRDRTPRGEVRRGRVHRRDPAPRAAQPQPRAARRGPRRAAPPAPAELRAGARRALRGAGPAPAELLAGARRAPRPARRGPRRVWVPRLDGAPPVTMWLPVVALNGDLLSHVRGDVLLQGGAPPSALPCAHDFAPGARALALLQGALRRFCLRRAAPPAAAPLAPGEASFVGRPASTADHDHLAGAPAARAPGHVQLAGAPVDRPRAPAVAHAGQRAARAAAPPRAPAAPRGRGPNPPNAAPGTGRRARRRRRRSVAAPPVSPPRAAAPPAAAVDEDHMELLKLYGGMSRKWNHVVEAVDRLDEIEALARATGRSPARETLRAVQAHLLRLLREYEQLETEANSLRASIQGEGGQAPEPPADLVRCPPGQLVPASVRRRLHMKDGEGDDK
ncbi:hypothetical protein ACP70R_008611 [Stipagrostis hirtigluma subsp. patula]